MHAELYHYHEVEALTAKPHSIKNTNTAFQFQTCHLDRCNEEG